MFWRVVSVVALGASLAACGTAAEVSGPLRPRILAPMERPSGSLEPPQVTDPAPFARANLRAYQIRGRTYSPEIDETYDRTGIASWYGDAFNGRPTANGETFDMHALTAAHTTLPLPCLVEVTNVATGARVIVRVNDRGPFAENRLIDLSRAAADALGLRAQGLGEVRVRYLGPAPRLGGGGQMLQASLEAPPPPPVREPDRPAPRQSGGGYFIQAGTFSERGNADALSRQLSRADPVRIEPIESGGRTLYRVLLGPWDGRGEAEHRRSTLAGQGLYDAILVSAE